MQKEQSNSWILLSFPYLFGIVCHVSGGLTYNFFFGSSFETYSYLTITTFSTTKCRNRYSSDGHNIIGPTGTCKCNFLPKVLQKNRKLADDAFCLASLFFE
jgi:hypothetical protein